MQRFIFTKNYAAVKRFAPVVGTTTSFRLFSEKPDKNDKKPWEIDLMKTENETEKTSTV